LSSGTAGATPLAGNRPTSREVPRRSKDADRIDLGRTWVPTRPFGVSTPMGLALDTTPRATEAARWPFLRFRAPSEVPIADPHGPADPWVGSSDRASSPGLPVPYDTLSGDRCLPTAVPPAARGGRVRGLATSLTTSTCLPTGARSAGASLGFTLQGSSPVCGASSSRSRCPPGVVGPCAAPWGAHRNAIASRALISTRVRTVVGPWGTDRRDPRGLCPLRAFSPSVRARRFGRAASPSTPDPS